MTLEVNSESDEDVKTAAPPGWARFKGRYSQLLNGKWSSLEFTKEIQTQGDAICKCFFAGKETQAYFLELNDTWAMGYKCENLENNRKREYVWISARDRNMTPEERTNLLTQAKTKFSEALGTGEGYYSVETDMAPVTQGDTQCEY